MGKKAGPIIMQVVLASSKSALQLHSAKIIICLHTFVSGYIMCIRPTTKCRVWNVFSPVVLNSSHVSHVNQNLDAKLNSLKSAQ